MKNISLHINECAAPEFEKELAKILRADTLLWASVRKVAGEYQYELMKKHLAQKSIKAN